MPTSARTDFGLRVLRARKTARMTQAVLAKAIGCTQANVAFTEHHSNASVLTVQIARATGADAEWLANGAGDMFKNVEDAPALPPAPSGEPSCVIRTLAGLLSSLDMPKRKAVGSLLQSLIDDPDQVDSITPDISYLIGKSHPKPNRALFLLQ